jgi:ATP-binding cassette subfamily B protein/ATP-binding cassette subfamily C protein
LIGLLTKLLSPASGKILVNGVDLEKLLIDDWLEKLAVVPQTFAELSECTVRENIGLGATSLLLQDPESVIDGEAVALGIKDFVELETYLGDEGRSRDISGKEKWQKNLSGGQMQCIALARAFVRKSAEVLIFDEPSSNLDPEAEHKLFNRLWKEKNNRITIFVSHRLQTCRASDCIIVMDQGSILQAGTHSELMVDTNGRYAKLTALQAAY